MKRLMMVAVLACTALGCTYPRETKMEPVEPTDAQMHTKEAAKTPATTNQ
jgi:hypothetical protein